MLSSANITFSNMFYKKKAYVIFEYTPLSAICKVVAADFKEFMNKF